MRQCRLHATPWYGWAPKITGMLIDVLLDPDRDFVVRRRLPRVLAFVPSARSVDGLFAALRGSTVRGALLCRPCALLAAQRSPGSDGCRPSGFGLPSTGSCRCKNRFGTAIACSTAAARRKKSGSSTINCRTAPIGISNTSSRCWPCCCRSMPCGSLFARSTPRIGSSREPLSNIWRAQPRPIRGNCCFRSWKPTRRTVRAPRLPMGLSKDFWRAERK